MLKIFKPLKVDLGKSEKYPLSKYDRKDALDNHNLWTISFVSIEKQTGDKGGFVVTVTCQAPNNVYADIEIPNLEDQPVDRLEAQISIFFSSGGILKSYHPSSLIPPIYRKKFLKKQNLWLGNILTK